METGPETDRIGKNGVKPHSRRHSVRDIGYQSHNQGSYRSRETGREENPSPAHSRLLEHAGIDENDVCHGEKCRKSRHDLSFQVGSLRLEIKEIVHVSKLLMIDLCNMRMHALWRTDSSRTDALLFPKFRDISRKRRKNIIGFSPVCFPSPKTKGTAGMRTADFPLQGRESLLV
jgi:hypothetical protein